MALLRHKTRGNSSPSGKPRVYLSFHPDDQAWADTITSDLLELSDCAVFYYDTMDAVAADDTHLSYLEQMQLLVIPVTKSLLRGGHTLETDLPFAQQHNIPLLPIMMEEGLLEEYTQIFGSLQFLNRCEHDSTAIAYKEKLANYLGIVMVDTEKIQRIRNAFDSYIFLSYRKKDRKYARELMRLIHNTENFSDVAIWYDEYLTPGEDFSEMIQDMLNKSPVFALMVTPNLLESGNYVMDHEYPVALQAGKPILAITMQETDRDQIQACYHQIPAYTDPSNPAALRAALHSSFQGIPLGKNHNNPDHMYYMGLAYLNGIDVEVDKDRAVSSLKNAAFADHLDAIEMLAQMYTYGNGVAQDDEKANAWRYRLHALLKQKLLDINIIVKTSHHIYTNDLTQLPMTKEATELLHRYLNNLQAVKEDCINHDWATKAFFDFFQNNTVPNLLYLKAYLPAYANNLTTDELKPVLIQLEKSYRQDHSKELQLLLAQTYLAASEFHKKYLKCSVSLFRKAIKEYDDPQARLGLAQALQHSITGSNCHSKATISVCWEIISLCLPLTENTTNIAAIRILADTVLKLPIPQNASIRYIDTLTSIQKLTELTIRPKQSTEDIQRLKKLYDNLSIYWSNQENEEKSCHYQAIAEAFQEQYHANHRNCLSTVYHTLAIEAESSAYSGGSLSWSPQVIALSKMESHYPEDRYALDVLLRKVHCAKATSSSKNTEYVYPFSSEAEHLWKHRVCRGAGILCAQLLLEELSYAKDPDQVSLLKCTEAICSICESLFFEWRMNTWLGAKHSVQEPLKAAKRAVDRAQSCPQTKMEVHNTYTIAVLCLEALDALEKGDIAKAQQRANFLMMFRDNPIFNATLFAQVHEILAFLAKEPETAKRHLEEAISLRKPHDHITAEQLLLAMDYCDLAEKYWQSGAYTQANNLDQTAARYAEHAHNTNRLEIEFHCCEQRCARMQDSAPLSAKRDVSQTLDHLEYYVMNQPELSSLQRYFRLVGKLDIYTHSSYEINLAFLLVQLDDRIENWQHLKKTYNRPYFLSNHQKQFLLTTQEKLLAAEDSDENRRHLAKLLCDMGILQEEALSEELDFTQPYQNRLSRAKALLSQCRDLTEADTALLKLIDYKLQTLSSDAEVRQKIYNTPLKPKLRSTLSTLVDDFSTIRVLNRKETSQKMEEISETANSICLRISTLSDALKIYEDLYTQYLDTCNIKKRRVLKYLLQLFGRKIHQLCPAAQEKDLLSLPSSEWHAYKLAGVNQALLATANRLYSQPPAAEKAVLSDRYAKFGTLYFDNMDYRKAADAWLQELCISDLSDSSGNTIERCINIADTFLDKHRILEAKPFILKAIFCACRKIDGEDNYNKESLLSAALEKLCDTYPLRISSACKRKFLASGTPSIIFPQAADLFRDDIIPGRMIDIYKILQNISESSRFKKHRRLSTLLQKMISAEYILPCETCTEEQLLSLRYDCDISIPNLQRRILVAADRLYPQDTGDLTESQRIFRYKGFGKVYLLAGQYKKAADIYFKGLEILQRSQDPFAIISYCEQVITAFLEKHRPSEAAPFMSGMIHCSLGNYDLNEQYRILPTFSSALSRIAQTHTNHPTDKDFWLAFRPSVKEFEAYICDDANRLTASILIDEYAHIENLYTMKHIHAMGKRYNSYCPYSNADIRRRQWYVFLRALRIR